MNMASNLVMINPRSYRSSLTNHCGEPIEENWKIMCGFGLEIYETGEKIMT